MILIVGLGNPGRDYVATRHNFGFMVLDHLAQECNLAWEANKKFKSLLAEVRGHPNQVKKIFLAKPQTYMNLSGEAVGELVRFYQLTPKQIWVVADDLDLPLGTIRVRHGGASGGHHGLESIEQALGSQDFTRIRLGIRGGKQPGIETGNAIDTNSFVTSPFAPEEAVLVGQIIVRATELIKEGIERGNLMAHSYLIAPLT